MNNTARHLVNVIIEHLGIRKQIYFAARVLGFVVFFLRIFNERMICSSVVYTIGLDSQAQGRGTLQPFRDKNPLCLSPSSTIDPSKQFVTYLSVTEAVT